MRMFLQSSSRRLGTVNIRSKITALSRPKSKKILIENLLRLEDGKDVNKDLIEKVLQNPEKKHEIF